MLGRLAFCIATFLAAIAMIVVLWPALAWLADMVAAHDESSAGIILFLGSVQALIGLLIGQCASGCGLNGISDWLLALLCALIGFAMGY